MICPGLRNLRAFSGCGNFSAKTGTVLGKWGWLVTLSFNYYPWLSSIPSLPPLHPPCSLSPAFIIMVLHLVCLFHAVKELGEKRIIRHTYIMLTLWKKLYQKPLERFALSLL